MRYADGLQALIGHTPLVRLRHLGVPDEVGLFAKLELWNPGGSVKDRIGLSMLAEAEARGDLRPGGAVIEATAGNTGIGIAVAALNRGYRVIFVVPTKFSAEKQQVLRALGAEVINTPREDGMLGAEAKAEELVRTIPGAVTLKQFSNPANPRAHYETTGPEIYHDLDGQVDYLVAGAGSGGTFSGVMRYLKERNPFIQGVLADPVGSIIGGGDHADYEIEGIGNDFIPLVMNLDLVDRVVKVTDDQALAGLRRLAAAEGILAGTSSGAALHAALEVASGLTRGNVVAILPDRGDRYLSKGIFG
ncbi:MAG: cysteine synthase family protein [Bifidobacteriaceae bacterium]|jgi:cysteine synthase A|nr:cysteine synthase family protein [Bifidobacteriaceae bacterium]